jgi:putative toxin-antitoxin system antitoxin component (TIGR02293 family)
MQASPFSSAASVEAARVASFLGLTGIAPSRVALADCVARGLPSETVEAVRDRVGADVFNLVIPRATLTRIRGDRRASTEANAPAKPLSREASEKLYEFGRVYELALRIYKGDEKRMMAFMLRPHALLEGRTPLQLATSSSAGADAVVDLLYRAEAGFAA